MPTENKPAEPFQREDRYIVIKRSDMDKAPAELRRSFSTQCRKLHDGMFKHGAPARQFVVVESDWPEYHLVWAMLEHRMAGKPVPNFNDWRRADELQQRLNAADQRNDELATSEVAMREDLAGANRRIGACINQIEEEQQRLTAAEIELARKDRVIADMLESNGDMVQHLTAAEQRNAELLDLLRECQPALDKAGYSTWQIDDALKPTESGAGE